MPANTYTMKHRGRGPLRGRHHPGLVALTYTDASGERSFRTARSGRRPGTLVSVAIVESVDVGGERFGFYRRRRRAENGSAEFRTAGVYETFSGPDSVPHRPASYRSIELRGTAQNVIHPLYGRRRWGGSRGGDGSRPMASSRAAAPHWTHWCGAILLMVAAWRLTAFRAGWPMGFCR